MTSTTDRSVSVSTRLQELKDEIDEQKQAISTLPVCAASMAAHAELIMILAGKEAEYELIHESQRVADVVREQNELHPPIYTDQCPICLDDMRLTSLDAIHYFPCCGSGLCKSCHDDEMKISLSQGFVRMQLCPMCRGTISNDSSISSSRFKHFAEKGRPWAQCAVGDSYLKGTDSYPVDREKALKLFEMASKQGDAKALYYLAIMSSEENGGHGDTRALRLMKESADLGYSYAQVDLAQWCSIRYNSTEHQRKAVHYITLACGGEDSEGRASFFLGMFYEGQVYRSKYYLQKAAGKGYAPAYYPLAQTLLQLNALQYKSIAMHRMPPGHDCIPKVLFWARKALGCVKSKAHARGLVNAMEGLVNQSCACCGRCDESFSSGTLKQCVRCKAARYCGRECQVKHWKDGHKRECVSKKN